MPIRSKILHASGIVFEISGAFLIFEEARRVNAHLLLACNASCGGAPAEYSGLLYHAGTWGFGLLVAGLTLSVIALGLEEQSEAPRDGGHAVSRKGPSLAVSVGWVGTAIIGTLLFSYLVSGFAGASTDAQLAAVAAIAGGLIGAAGTAVAVYLTLAAQRRDEAQKAETALRMEVAEFARLTLGPLFFLCERILVGGERIPMRDLPALIALPEPIVYKATADRISRLPYGRLLVAFHGRIAEARSMATISASTAQPPQIEGGRSPPERMTDTKTAKALGTALAEACDIARTILRADPTSTERADQAITTTLSNLDEAHLRAEAILNPTCAPATPSPNTSLAGSKETTEVTRTTDDFHDRSTYLARYAEHSSRLQNWIGGYGAGLASALIYQFRAANNDAIESLKNLPLSSTAYLNGQRRITDMHYDLKTSLTLIAVALGLQIVLLFLNKISQWSLTHMDGDASKWSFSDRLGEWFSRQIVIDAALDISSVLLLGVSTFEALKALSLIS